MNVNRGDLRKFADLLGVAIAVSVAVGYFPHYTAQQGYGKSAGMVGAMIVIMLCVLYLGSRAVQEARDRL